MFTFVLFCLYFKIIHLKITFLEFILRIRDYILLVLDTDPKRLGIQLLPTYNKVLKYLFCKEDFGSSSKTLFMWEGMGMHSL